MKNILIGFLMATCIFLMMGLTDEEPVEMEMFVDGQVSVECEAPKYQGFAADKNRKYMINTETGVVYQMIKDSDTWERKSPETDWIKE